MLFDLFLIMKTGNNNYYICGDLLLSVLRVLSVLFDLFLIMKTGNNNIYLCGDLLLSVLHCFSMCLCLVYLLFHFYLFKGLLPI